MLIKQTRFSKKTKEKTKKEEGRRERGEGRGKQEYGVMRAETKG